MKTMNSKDKIITSNGNQYLYLGKNGDFHYLSKINYFGIDEKKRYDFWNSHHLLDRCDWNFTADYSSQLLKENLANLRQLLIEVTDGCNLACKYCGYGDLYSNYDKRENKKQSFNNVKALIDYLYRYWNSPSNISYENKISIGVYGGEPLLNFELIKEIIDYVETLQLSSLKFVYNMTTNAVLLNKYMDFLVEHDFHLLLSLDGDKQNDSYRVTKNGSSSFDVVVSNILKLKEEYPDFFGSNVSFNSVLHNRNSVEETVNFIWKAFGKIPNISALNTNGIADEKKEEFQAMFMDKSKSFKNVVNCEPLRNESYIYPDNLHLNSFLSAFTKSTYRSYGDLFLDVDDCEYIPTGTCTPFDRKIFLTVNGKLLPCEKIGQEKPVGYLQDGRVVIDFDKIIAYYGDRYRQLIAQCKVCYQPKNCSCCIYQMEEKNGKIVCSGFRPKKLVERKQFAYFLSMLENEPKVYNKILSEITID